jgi:hypothetical protein
MIVAQRCRDAERDAGKISNSRKQEEKPPRSVLD